MRYLHALVWGIIIGSIIRLWAYPMARAKYEAFDLDDVWEIWDEEELM